MNRSRVAAAFFLAFPLQAAAQAGAAPMGESWRFDANIFFPGISSSTRIGLPGGGNIATESDPDGYLKKLQMVFMGTVSTQRGPWSYGADFLYLNLDDVDSKVREITGPGGAVTIPIDSGTHSDLKGFIGTLNAGYRVVNDPGSRMDLLGGVRYARLEVEVDWELSGPTGGLAARGGANSKKDFWDGIVGVRGTMGLGGNWDFRYYADMGAGDSKFTWQAVGGIGYRFGWGDATLSYRHLVYEMRDDRPVADVTFSGPQLAIGFTF